jgi:4-hydroxy-3-methylbut-2-enyl diphosphate reductase
MRNIMEVIVAEHAGFCFGVTKAVETVYEQIEKENSNIYTYGPIIHNETVVSDLEKKGVKVIESVDELEGIGNGTVVIRSHGVTKEVHQKLEESGLNVIDATCPFVKRIHRIVEEESKKGKSIIVVGSESHPEVEGIVSYATGPVYVIDSPEKAMEFGEEMKQRYGFKDVKYTYSGPTIGSNCGPGLMAIFFWGKKRTMDGYKG